MTPPRMSPRARTTRWKRGANLKTRSVAEDALEAWEDLEPSLSEPYAVDARRLPELKAVIARKSARELPSGQVPAAEPPGLKGGMQTHGSPNAPRVHFLYFWEAFRDAAAENDSLAGYPQIRAGELTAEFEVLRDRLLLRLEAAPGSGKPSPCLPPWALVEEVHRLAPISSAPRFWQAAVEALDARQHEQHTSIGEATETLVSWLQLALAWQPESSAPMGEPLALVTDGLPVRLHIYNASRQDSIQLFNQLFAHESAPMKLCGIFHAGVEVNGLEWSFDFQPRVHIPGVSCVLPRMHQQHKYRETIVLQPTPLSAVAISNVISQMLEEYPGHDYDLLRRNCCHFADDLCQRLGVGGIPPWVHRLANLGAQLDTALNTARFVKECITPRAFAPAALGGA